MESFDRYYSGPYRIRYFDDKYKWILEKMWQNEITMFYYAINRFDSKEEALDYLKRKKNVIN